MTQDDEEYTLALTLPVEFKFAVGSIAILSTLLDNILSNAIGDLLDVSPIEARVVSSQMNTRPKLEIFWLLAHTRLLKTADIEAAEKHISAIEQAQSDRRLVIHGVWATKNDQIYVLKFWGGKRGFNRLDFEAIPMSEEKLMGIRDTAEDAFVNFHNWWDQAKRELIPSPYRPA